jgi:hypothetical protein
VLRAGLEEFNDDVDVRAEPANLGSDALVRSDDLNQTRMSAWLGVAEARRGATQPAGNLASV